MQFHRYHALGNDYLVLDPRFWPDFPSSSQIQRICHRQLGLGSDGILWGPLPAEQGDSDFKLRIFNPDGSEAEKSGNGLRIFCRYLWDLNQVSTAQSFQVETLGGTVTAQVWDKGREVTISMGQVSFDSQVIPVAGLPRQVLLEKIELGDEEFTFSAASIGNPHCVLRVPQATATLAQKWGPVLEKDKRFPNRSNVQFLEVLDPQNLRIEIWERGAGYTLASGSSSSAAAAVAHRLGWCENQVTVQMPGGNLQIHISSDFHITMRGPVTKICQGVADLEFFEYRFPEEP